MKFSIKDSVSKYDQIRRELTDEILNPHLLKKCLMENLIFCAVKVYFYKNTLMENLINKL